MHPHLIAPGQAVHLHQLALGVQHQLSEGEQLRGKGAFREVSLGIGGLPELPQCLGERERTRTSEKSTRNKLKKK